MDTRSTAARDLSDLSLRADRLRTLIGRSANSRGLALLRERNACEQITCTPDEFAAAIDQLVSDGTIVLLSPPPFVAARLTSWSRRSLPPPGISQQVGGKSGHVQYEVPVSSSAAAAKQEDGGAGEGEALLQEVLTVLGPEAEAKEFAVILRPYSPTLVRRCLRRVQATRSIRVSRAALFRALLGKLSN